MFASANPPYFGRKNLNRKIGFLSPAEPSDLLLKIKNATLNTAYSSFKNQSLHHTLVCRLVWYCIICGSCKFKGLTLKCLIFCHFFCYFVQYFLLLFFASKCLIFCYFFCFDSIFFVILFALKHYLLHNNIIMSISMYHEQF